MSNENNIHLIIEFNGGISLADFEKKIIAKFLSYIKKGYGRIFIHYVGILDKPEYLYYFRKLLNTNIAGTIFIKHHKNIGEAVDEADGESYEIIRFDQMGGGSSDV